MKYFKTGYILAFFFMMLSLYFSIWNYYVREIDSKLIIYVFYFILYCLIIIYCLLLIKNKVSFKQRLLFILATFTISIIIGLFFRINRYGYTAYNDPLGQLIIMIYFLLNICVVFMGFISSIIIHMIWSHFK
jgi:hypothetical protein